MSIIDFCCKVSENQVNLQTFCKFSWGTALSYSPFTFDLRSSLLTLDRSAFGRLPKQEWSSKLAIVLA